MPAIEDEVLNGATIELAIARAGLMDAWSAGQPVLLQGHSVRRHFDVPCAQSGWLRARGIRRHAWGGLEFRLSIPGGGMATDGCFRRRFPTADERAAMAADERIAKRLRARGRTFEEAIEAMTLVIDTYIGFDRWIYFEAHEKTLRVVLHDRLPKGPETKFGGHMGMWVEPSGAQSFLIHGSSAFSHCPDFNGFVVDLSLVAEADVPAASIRARDEART
ncbi:MAG: hypothetical protein HOW73_44095 [Polyangiaceae bacterium]|nr:hypothetical protein [Polyangiaceae bacterium]